ncbi:hypothetical protein [Streptomyces sp. NPDC007264]|uniref:hypothetical protein n=1 Tax=Streptomyces sp. NPDC007264 TaxID=3364777 RepID=UPI0036DED2CC
MNVDDIVAAKIEAARFRAENAKRRRAAFAVARQRGLAARHAAKLRNQAAKNFLGSQENPTTKEN